MSLTSHGARKLAVAGLSALAAFGAVATSAQAAQLTQNYQCKYPLIGVQPLKVDINAAIPSSWPVGESTNAFVINAVATAAGSTSGAMQLIGAQSIEGVAKASASITSPTGSLLPLKVPITVASWNRTPGTLVPNPLILNAQGSTPPLTFDDPGQVKIAVDAITLNLTARNAAGLAIPLMPVTKDVDGNAVTPSDSDPGTFDVPCKLVAGQSTQLTSVTIGSGGSPSSDAQAPSKPAGLSATSSANTTSLRWSASSDNVGVSSYEVSRNGGVVATVDKTSVTIPGLLPGSSSQYTVTAVDAAGNRTASDPATFSTPQGGTAELAIANYKAALTGTARLHTLITGQLPLEGSITAEMNVATGKLVADLNLLPRTGRLAAIGILPVTARVGFFNATRTTGQLDSEGVLTTTTLLRIKLHEIKLFGAIQIAGGNNCQTKQFSTIVLRSAPNFDPVVGGEISGKFAISDLNDCGFLTGIVSPLTAGSGNSIVATLKPQL